jgi:hypothetical protein
LKEAAPQVCNRYGISIDFGLEVVGTTEACGLTVKSKLIDLRYQPTVTVA